MNHDSKSTDWLLDQWARWSRVNPGVSLWYQSGSMFSRLTGTTLKSPIINDDEAMVVDHAVARLNVRDSEMAQALVVYYFSGGNTSHVARALDMNRRKADTLVKASRAWVDGVLARDEKKLA